MSVSAAHVAGGRGFLGKAIARALVRDGWQVSVSGREGVPLDEARHSEDTLIWSAGGREGAPAALWHVHVEAACAAVSARPALRRMIYVSSGEVYGEQAVQAVPFVEDAPLLGNSPYALAKLRGEDALSALCWQRDVALTIVRPSLIYGPEQAPTMLLPAAIRALLGGEPFPATAGLQTRDWIFVDDVAAAVALIAARPRAANVYNLASQDERTVHSALTLAASLVGESAASLLRFGALPYRAHETMRYCLSSARARRDLAWSPRTPLEDGLAACIAAARQQLQHLRHLPPA